MKKGLFLSAGILAATTVFAQEPAPVAAAPEPASMTLQQIIAYGGWLMYPLFALSLVGVALIVYFLVTLREEQILPRAFVANLRELLAGGRFVEAQAVCRSNTSAISSIMGVAIEHRLRSNRPDPVVIGEIVTGEGTRQATLIQNQIQYLVDLSGVAPMIGLLGTVTGMLQAFNAVALDLAKAKPIVLAAGVSQALITTVAGLLIAIPAMIAYAYFRGRTARMIADLETASADLSALISLER